jgi:hypothetical protein
MLLSRRFSASEISSTVNPATSRMSRSDSPADAIMRSCSGERAIARAALAPVREASLSAELVRSVVRSVRLSNSEPSGDSLRASASPRPWSARRWPCAPPDDRQLRCLRSSAPAHPASPGRLDLARGEGAPASQPGLRASASFCST